MVVAGSVANMGQQGGGVYVGNGGAGGKVDVAGPESMMAVVEIGAVLMRGGSKGAMREL